MPIPLTTPLDKKLLRTLKAGDNVLLSGTVYTARDAAHQRLINSLNTGRPLPFELKGACLYYTGPTPAPPGAVIGSAGPTTAERMDAYTPPLLERGLAAMIGKGPRSWRVQQSVVENGAVYFGFVGGAAALAAKHIKSAELLAWPELASEAVYKLTVQDFPLTVLLDSHGNDLYIDGPYAYLKANETS